MKGIGTSGTRPLTWRLFTKKNSAADRSCRIWSGRGPSRQVRQNIREDLQTLCGKGRSRLRRSKTGSSTKQNISLKAPDHAQKKSGQLEIKIPFVCFFFLKSHFLSATENKNQKKKKKKKK